MPAGARASARLAPGARLAGAEQAVAQLGLLLGARVPAGHVGELLEAAQAEELQELGGGAVLPRAELGVACLLDQAALQQRRSGGVCAYSPDRAEHRARELL